MRTAAEITKELDDVKRALKERADDQGAAYYIERVRAHLLELELQVEAHERALDELRATAKKGKH